ncbi:MAG: IS30 family transposase [Magnetospirillum sp.]|nr:MAG: IS30 family transposase [Magnetospirillum sp.]
MSYTQLTSDERHSLYHLLLMGLSLRAIARKLSRDPSTISRELRRNAPPAVGHVYIGSVAQAKAIARRRRPRHKRRGSHAELQAAIAAGLDRKWSPEQIAGRLKLDFPDDTAMRVSPETIYASLYADARAGGTRYLALRRQHRKRRRQPRFLKARSRIPGRVSIAERPACVQDRSRFGDWEGDLVMGAKACGAVVTLVERKSRFLLARPLADKTADGLNRRVSGLLKAMPAGWRRTLTLDNGSEFARFKTIEEATGISVFFADPYSAWQRGSNENTNGLLRQYFPKGCDFRAVSSRSLAKAVAAINHRPRKCLGYRTPHEVRFGFGGAL